MYILSESLNTCTIVTCNVKLFETMMERVKSPGVD